MRRIRIATRTSILAQRQAALVAEAIRSIDETIDTELVLLGTAGDARSVKVSEIGGKGVFTAELEAALRAGEVDLAVHSAKDLPVAMAEDLQIAAVPPRDDPRDALVSRGGGALADLPGGAKVGTGSLRRRAQLLATRSDLQVVSLRGNVETRLGKVICDEPPLDAVVVAMAGLNRSGLASRYAGKVHPLELDQFVPAAGQGALAVQTLLGRGGLGDLLARIDDPDSHKALTAERSVIAALHADCHSCIGVHIARAADRWGAQAMVASPDGTDVLRERLAAPSPDAAAARITEALLQAGAVELLSR